MPAAVVRKINLAINEALRSPEVVKRFTADGSTPKGTTPQEFGAHIRAQVAKWRKLAREANLKLN